ncbi:uncharacterized protein Triagg1_5599 [Trichoderma aggressivum f. europaeum]|uniref:Carrier domain-containing protein n=1 Tax=Trichoderma aggressivum f. europaeum TaxID=173218 RepID=A0AAE1J5J4_9HYPO|nr:hypothetical protein Triagg1_5599 [Trichoderma aggressivum f. europaeum]
MGFFAEGSIESSRSIATIMNELTSQVKANGLGEVTLVQRCGKGINGNYTLGLVVNADGDLASVQHTLQTWNNATCVQGLASTKQSSVTIFSKPTIKSSVSTRGIKPRDGTCSTIQVVSGDSCGSLTAECGISAQQFAQFNPSSTLCSTLAVGQYVCYTSGSLTDRSPKPNPDGSCAKYNVQPGDYCSLIAAENSIATDDIENFNKNTWGWQGCGNVQLGQIICLSIGSPPFPAAVSNGNCGPQVPRTQSPADFSTITALNSCPLNACCDIFGQSGITPDFCTASQSATGALGTSAPGTAGCISNCGIEIVNNINGPSEFIKVGYWESFGLDRPCLQMPVSAIPSGYTHIHYAFATLTSDFQVEVSEQQDAFNQFASANSFKRILSFGYWLFSTDVDSFPIFRESVTDANRLTFVPSVVDIVNNKPDSTKDDQFIESILSVFKHQFVDNIDDESKNAEYFLKDNELLTNRLIDAQNVNGFIHSNFAEADRKQEPLGEAGRPIMLDTSSPGPLNALHFATDPVWARPMAENEVEVEIRAVVLTSVVSSLPWESMWQHVLETKQRAMSLTLDLKVTNVQVGDRVVYMSGLVDGGCLKTFGRQSADAVVKLPDSVSFEDAASLPCVYSTAIHGLYHIAHLSEGETVLIHAAAGGVGQAAIQLANLVGAEVFATVSTPEKRDLLINEYGVKKDHIFSSRDLSFVKGIMRMTNNRGIDVVLNSLSGDALRASWDVLAPFGRFIEIGKKDAQSNGRIDLSPLLRQTVMASVDLTIIMNYKPEKLGQLITETVRLFAEGKVRLAKPTRVMDYTQIEEAFRSLQSGKSMGKTVFKPNPTDIVPIIPEKSSPLQFDQNASYVLAGGLGGLGRSIARWMVSRGAKHLIFISRSGAAGESAQGIVQELEATGCNIHIFACDVSDEVLLSYIIDQCKANLPERAAFKDSMFENMTYENFQDALRPKFRGSWNLHKLLPASMDFFLLLSSMMGILGNRSQANYAAGNTYQDALAIHRHSLGLPATSIDLGSILSVGYVAENKSRLKTVPSISSVLESIREDEIHLILKYHLDQRHPGSSQTVSGLTNAALYKQRRMPVPTYLKLPLFRHLQSETSAANDAVDDDPILLVPIQLATATAADEAVVIVSNGIRLKLSKLLSMTADDIDLGKSISSNGIDSLVATEFRTWLARTLEADLPVLDIMGTSSILTLSEKVVSLSKLVQVATSS